MSTALREIIASFGATFDPSGLKQGDSAVAGMITKLKGFATAVAGAFAIKEVLGFTMGLAEQAVELEHHAQALGISAQSLQQWDFAASLSGVSAEELQIGLQKLQRSAVGAGGKGGELAAVFTKLGVSVKNANGVYKNADELLTDVAGAIGDMTDPTLQTATAMQIFGRGGARLLPFLKQGREGIAALKAEVEKLGGGFTEDFIKKSQDMVQDSKRLEFAFLSFKVKALGPLIPILSHVAEKATEWAVVAGNMIGKSNAAKTALLALGIGGAIALAPLLASIAPLVAGFLVFEDVLTFLSGGKSLTGDAVDKFFGAGSAAKVQAFASVLSADLGPMLHDVMAIFTDGKPLDEKFKELDIYIAGTLGPNFKAEFGKMGDDVTTIISLAASLAETLKDIIEAMRWIGSHTVDAIGSAIFSGEDADADRAAKIERRKADGNENLDDKVQGWFDGLLGGGPGGKQGASGLDFRASSAQVSAPAPALSAGDLKALIEASFATANVASAPVPAYAKGSPDVHQTNTTTVNQYFTADTPDAVKNAAAIGAKSGVSEGNNLRTKRALVPTG